VKKLILLAALALTPALTPCLAQAADVNGNWALNGVFNTMGIKFALNCHFAQAGAKLTGVCRDPARPDAAINPVGSVSGNQVVFAYDTNYMGVAVHLTYKAAVQANGSLAGSVDAVQAQGTFSGVRTK